MLNEILALLFSIALVATVSTYVSRGKRWWGSRGYRVRIVRRNAWVGLGAVFAVLLISQPARQRTCAYKCAPCQQDNRTGKRTQPDSGRRREYSCVACTRDHLWARPGKPERRVLLRHRAMAGKDAFRRGPRPR